MSGAVVICVGNPYRRDDGVGPALADLLTRLPASTVDVVVADGEPAQLLDAWTGVGLAIVVDAVLCEQPQPGRIHRTSMADLAASSFTSSHGMGVPEAALLGAALDRLPQRLVVYAVEAAHLGFGTDLSPEVAAALPELVIAVLTEIRTFKQEEKRCLPDTNSKT
jgi:hydrogenase maturation protease